MMTAITTLELDASTVCKATQAIHTIDCPYTHNYYNMTLTKDKTSVGYQ